MVYTYDMFVKEMLGDTDLASLSESAQAKVKLMADELVSFSYTGEFVKCSDCPNISAFAVFSENKHDFSLCIFQHKADDSEKEYRFSPSSPNNMEYELQGIGRGWQIFKPMELALGVLFRSTVEGGDGVIRTFSKRRRGVIPETPKSMDVSGWTEAKLSSFEAEVLKRALEENEPCQKLSLAKSETLKCYRATISEGGATAFFAADSADPDKSELILFYCQEKGETSREYRVGIPVPDDYPCICIRPRTAWMEGTELRCGFVVRSSDKDKYSEVFPVRLRNEKDI